MDRTPHLELEEQSVALTDPAGSASAITRRSSLAAGLRLGAVSSALFALRASTAAAKGHSNDDDQGEDGDDQGGDDDDQGEDEQ